MNFQFLWLILWCSYLGLMTSIASSPCTHQHPLTGSRTRRNMRTVQKSLCSLSLNIFPEEDRPIGHEKLSSSVVPLEAQLCHFEWLSHTQRNTHDFCVSTVLPISVPSSCVSVRQPIPHMHIIISVSSCIVTFAEHVLHLKSPLPC